MSKAYTGGCLCGAVRYEIEAEPMVAGHCQCRDCQRMTGAGHSSMLAFPRPAVRITGPLKGYGVKADSGNTATRSFCGECGAFVAASSSGMPDMVTIAATSLDDPSRFVPQMVVYTRSGHAWDALDPALPKFEHMPPMMASA